MSANATANDPLYGPGTQALSQTLAGYARVTLTGANPVALADGSLNPNVFTIGADQLVFNGQFWDRLRTPKVFTPLSAVVITSETTIWTPAAGKKFRLMGFCLAQGVATGAVTLKDNTAGTTILVIPQNTIGVFMLSPPMGNGILSAVANNVLTATGASTETLTGFVFGTEE